MGTTPLFQNTSNTIDGYNGQRILDIYAPINTKIYSFTDGIIYDFGYNAEKGDYGHVIIMEYNNIGLNNSTLYALYGHLSKKSIQGKYIGRNIKKGGVIGYIGNVHENGGWENPHVHFQLSRNKPKTHDMPGVVSLYDKERAL